jgi:hypothetical protein
MHHKRPLKSPPIGVAGGEDRCGVAATAGRLDTPASARDHILDRSAACRLHEHGTQILLERSAGTRGTGRELVTLCGGYHLLDPETGHALSLSLWQDEAALLAAEREGPADGRINRTGRPTVRIVRVAAVF